MNIFLKSTKNSPSLPQQRHRAHNGRDIKKISLRILFVICHKIFVRSENAAFSTQRPKNCGRTPKTLKF